MAENAEKTAAQIFSEIGDSIDKQSGFDAELAKIIVENVLVVTGEDQATSKALEAIKALAQARAAVEE